MCLLSAPRIAVRGIEWSSAPRKTPGYCPASLPREADLGVAHPVDGAGPDGIRAAGAVERDGLEVEQLPIRAAARALRADGSALHREGVDDGERREAATAVGALEVGLEPLALPGDGVGGAAGIGVVDGHRHLVAAGRHPRVDRRARTNESRRLGP